MEQQRCKLLQDSIVIFPELGDNEHAGMLGIMLVAQVVWTAFSVEINLL
jgi:NaMN:DMB phosphoribosyltransferase